LDIPKERKEENLAEGPKGHRRCSFPTAKMG